MSEIKNTYQDYKLSNGETVKLTLTFGKLNLLKSVNKNLYTEFNGFLYGKSEDFLDIAKMIYVFYWCANYNGTDKIYTEQEFLDLIPFDINEIKRVFASLTEPKKK